MEDTEDKDTMEDMEDTEDKDTMEDMRDIKGNDTKEGYGYKEHKDTRVASMPATMSCLNRCLPNPKLLINFIYLLKEIQNVIFGLDKSFSEF